MSLPKWIFPLCQKGSVEGSKHRIQSTRFSKGNTVHWEIIKICIAQKRWFKVNRQYNLIKLFQISEGFCLQEWRVLALLNQSQPFPGCAYLTLGPRESQSQSRSSCGNSKMWNVGQRVVIKKSTGERSRDKTQILETFWSLIIVSQVISCQFPLMI